MFDSLYWIALIALSLLLADCLLSDVLHKWSKRDVQRDGTQGDEGDAQLHPPGQHSDQSKGSRND